MLSAASRRFYLNRLTGLALLLLCLTASFAYARIDILPRKVIIDNKNRVGEITVLNVSDEAGTYRIDITNYRQDENGIYQTLNTPLNPDFDPETVARISPRRFTLPPGGRQKIRVSLRNPAELPVGEYRFHVMALQATNKTRDNYRPKNDRGQQVTATPSLGVSIPVVVKHGDIDATVKMSGVTLVGADRTESHKPEIHLRVDRQGNAGIMGTIIVEWEPADGGKPRQIGEIGNMNIFTEIAYRNVQIPLRELPGGPGLLRLVLLDDYQKGRTFDEITLQK